MRAQKRVLRVRIGGKRQITLPREATNKFGLGTGDELQARILEDRIELIPMVAVRKDQTWFWAPEWQAKEREAETARATGAWVDFESVDDLIANLKK